MSDEQKKLVSRREMLRLTGATGLGLLATACGAQPETITVVETVVVEKEVEKTVIETVEVEKEVVKEVEKVVTVEVAQESGAMATVEGALWILQKKDFHPDYNEYVRAQINEYANEQGWPLDLSYIAGFASGTGEVEKIAAAVQAGDPPDMVMSDLSAVQLRNLYVVQPVTDVVEAVEEVYGPAAPYLRQLTYLDDQWWAIPYHQRTDGGYYRRDAFDKAGIDLQTIRQFEPLREATLAVSDPDNEFYGWGITVNRSGDGNFLINRIKTGYGASWQDETGQFIRTNSPEMIEAMEFIRDTYSDPKYETMLPPGVLAWNDISNNEAYLGGVIAYTQNAGTVYAKAVVDNNPVAEHTNYHKPVGGPVNQEFLGLSSSNWNILRGAKNGAAAKQLALEFTANLERMNAMLASSPAYAVPAYTNLWEMSEFVSNFEPAYQVKSAALDDSGINAEAWPGQPSAAMTGLNESGIWNDMVNAILTGTDVETAVAEAHDRMVLVFQEFDLPGVES